VRSGLAASLFGAHVSGGTESVRCTATVPVASSDLIAGWGVLARPKSRVLIIVGVVVIAWHENHDGIWITLEYVDECHGNGHASTAIQRLRDDTRLVQVP
jgi:hypothetical protein